MNLKAALATLGVIAIIVAIGFTMVFAPQIAVPILMTIVVILFIMIFYQLYKIFCDMFGY